MGFYVDRDVPESCEKCDLHKIVGVDRWKCLLSHVEFDSWEAGWGSDEHRHESCPMKVARCTGTGGVFESDELDMISDGLLALLEKAYEAKKLTAGSDACAAAIDEYARKIKSLNSRICDVMED